MKTTLAKSITLGAWFLLLSFSIATQVALAQWPYAAPAVTPQAQRNALNTVRTQVSNVQNATRVAGNYGAEGHTTVWRAFQMLRQSYSEFRATLNPKQLAYGANQLAELDAGLDIIQEAFPNYDQDLASGRSYNTALGNLCSVVRESTSLWQQELNKVSNRIRVGSGL